MEVKIEASWKQALATEFTKPYFTELTDFVRQEYQTKTIYPAPKNIFAAFDFCPISNIKAVIIGQDPYHGPRQAQGLCFSVPDDIKIPPSLVNIYKEIASDIGKTPAQSGNLQHWAQQGVFLLNATLTVQAHKAGSHQNKGWETFTDQVIQQISNKNDNVVFLLWGAYAGRKAALINNQKHLILKAPHPSPLSAHRGFFGCKHFSQTNQFLESKGLTPINW